jgi:putative flippase GtrA
LAAIARYAWFVVVGCAAAAVHLGVVILLVDTGALRPLSANVAGWLLAFTVSFAGHWQLTFRAPGGPWRAAAQRFFAVSLAGFVANECAYAAVLRWSRLPYDLVLAGVLVATAVMTYLLSSRWAFRRNPRP